MNSKVSFLSVIIFCLFSCNNKVPYVPDYEMGKGTVIGIETCNNDISRNAWLISFQEPSVSGNAYGMDIIYDNKPYKRVVRTFSLPDSLRIVGGRYYFEFDLEGRSIPECQPANSSAYNLMKIHIRKVTRISN